MWQKRVYLCVLKNLSDMEDQQLLSPKKYAEHIGCDIVIIDRAIKAGKIPAESVTVNPVNKWKTINVEMADAAWGSTYMETRRKPNRSVLRKLSEENYVANPLPSPFKAKIEESKGEMPALGATTSYTEAERQKKIYEATLLKLKAEEEDGRLVRIDVIENAFFEHARIIRDNFSSLSDRIIDSIVSAGTRNEAHIVLQKEINQVLEGVSRLPQWRND